MGNSHGSMWDEVGLVCRGRHLVPLLAREHGTAAPGCPDWVGGQLRQVTGFPSAPAGDWGLCLGGKCLWGGQGS